MRTGEPRKSEFSAEEFAESRLQFIRPIATGARMIVLDRKVQAQSEFIEAASTGFDPKSRVATFSLELGAQELEESDAVVYEEMGIAVIDHHDGAEQSSAIVSMLAGAKEVVDSIPEFLVFPNHAVPIASAMYMDNAQFTWGLQAVGVPQSNFSGKGIKVAVLDTGIDEQHPDFQGRIFASRSFVPNESADDLNGHGTHTSGTVAGPDSTQPRYGVSPDADLLVGKVLSNRGSGRQRDIISAIIWGIKQGAQIISMSLGRATRPGEPFDPVYERTGQTALDNDCLIIAAAGNDSARRFGYIAPVGAPANSPSIMAVAALDQDLIESDFSCGGINPNGGEVDIAAPGVAVYSSWPMPRRYRAIRGTSMACPHVAGVAALFAESDPTLRGAALWKRMTDTAVDINRNARDVGAGLVQAP